MGITSHAVDGESVYMCIVCGTKVIETNALCGKKYPFWIYCSEHCKDKYESNLN